MKRIKKNKKNSEYLIKIIKQNPKICSGRRNYEYFYNRILNNIDLIKKFKKKI